MTCEQRIKEALESRLSDIRQFAEAGFPTEYEDQPNSDQIGVFHEYGLCWDYVRPNTFEDQPEGYYRYQLSCGGPSEEFRFFGHFNSTPDRVEFRFHDQFDGAGQDLTGESYDVLLDVWDQFDGAGMCNSHL